MIKRLEGNSYLIISHIADIDGMGSVILARKYYDDAIDYILCEVSDVVTVLQEIDSSSYARIYICDLQLNIDAINYLNKRGDLVEKLKHFDHHSSMINESTPAYCNYVLAVDGRKTCATELFYRFMLTLDTNFNKKFYKSLVEGIRANDTWDTEGDFELGSKLASIYTILGPELFMDMVLSLNDNNPFELPKVYSDLVQADFIKMNNYIDNVNNHIAKKKYNNHVVGITISEQFRSVLGDEICKRNKDIDYVLIINFDRMTCSLRCIRNDIDLGLIAQEFHHGGGGHRKAAGFVIDKESTPKIKSFIDEYLNNLNNNK